MSAKDQLAAERRAHRQQRESDRQHIQTLQRELERAKAISVIEIRELQAKLGRPIIEELIIAYHQRVQAADPLRSAPMENTMRVTHANSEKMGDDPTEHHRKVIEQAHNEVRRAIRTLKKGMGEPPLEYHAPRCRRQECDLRDRRQDFGRKKCRSCGEPIS